MVCIGPEARVISVSNPQGVTGALVHFDLLTELLTLDISLVFLGKLLTLCFSHII